MENLLRHGKDEKTILLAPFLNAKASVLREELPSLERRGFQRVRIDGELKRLDDRDLIPKKPKAGNFGLTS